MHLFKDKVALVTGSTGEGMGRSIAFTLAREGAKVVLNYGTAHPNNILAAEKVLSEVRALGGKGYAIKADTRVERDVEAMINGVITLYGQIDFLICNAGSDWHQADMTGVDHDHWRSVIGAEIDGLFLCVKYSLPYMRKAHTGRIIALGMAGADHWSGPPYDYILGKSARSSLIKSLAAQEIKNGITCNVIAPSQTPRVTFRQAVDAAKHGGSWKRRTRTMPQDAAEVVRFLCSEEAAFVTGSVIELAQSSL